MMTGERLFPLGVACCCLLAIGFTAASMDAAVQTDPDDVIDIRYESIPLGEDAVDDLKQRIQSERPDADRPAGQTRADRGEVAQATRVEQVSRAVSAGAAGGSQSGSGAGTDDGSSLLDWLLDLLRTLVTVLLAALAVVTGVGVLVFAARHRDRLRALASALVGSDADEETHTGPTTPTPPPTPAPSNEVEEAWFEMVSTLGLSKRLSATPGECASAAIAAGADRDSVERLTAVFEEVRYGGAPVTDTRRERIRRALDEFRPQRSGGGDS